MEATQVSPSQSVISRTHPMLLVAAASVSLFSLADVGVLAGWLPGPGAKNVAPAQLATAPAAAPISVQQQVSNPQEKTRPAAKSSERATASVRRTAPSAVSASPAVAVPPAPTYAVAAHEPVYRVATPPPAICNECGVVESVREVAVEPKGSGGGAIAGGLLGGIIANQIGKGTTRDIATVLGAVGGAYAGNHIEKSVKESKRYDVLVRFEDGSTRSFSSESVPAWQSGDRVRLQNGLLTMGGGRSNGNPGTI
ncbi:MAG: glycine zipper 2TM domain-containing protein [Sulfuritalea sp.]|nr:glycine zipper 2TM domain-containing protein [Sulfuritalea sp.]